MSCSYECDYCENALCTEICPEAITAYQRHLVNKDDNSSEEEIVFYEGVL